MRISQTEGGDRSGYTYGRPFWRAGTLPAIRLRRAELDRNTPILVPFEFGHMTLNHCTRFSRNAQMNPHRLHDNLRQFRDTQKRPPVKKTGEGRDSGPVASSQSGDVWRWLDLDRPYRRRHGPNGDIALLLTIIFREKPEGRAQCPQK